MTAEQVSINCEANVERIRKSLTISERPMLLCYEACMEIAFQLALLVEHFKKVDTAVFGDKQ